MIFRKRYVSNAALLSFGERSGKEAGPTLNFVVKDVRDLLRIKNWSNNITNSWTLELNHLHVQRV